MTESGAMTETSSSTTAPQRGEKNSVPADDPVIPCTPVLRDFNHGSKIFLRLHSGQQDRRDSVHRCDQRSGPPRRGTSFESSCWLYGEIWHSPVGVLRTV